MRIVDQGDVNPEQATASPEPGRELEQAVRTLLAEIGEDPQRAGLVATPQRVRRMYAELTDGYRTDPDSLLNGAAFEVDYDEMVVVRDIEFFSLCEHHLLPFFGKAHVGYLPNGRIIGLSKIPRIVDMYAHRLQVQERMTQQVATFLMERLDPKGVGCVVEATHLCTVMRGVRKQEATMVTSAMLGTFRRDGRTRSEFLTFIGRTSDR
jgi:GTP cyclohydrolase I